MALVGLAVPWLTCAQAQQKAEPPGHVPAAPLGFELAWEQPVETTGALSLAADSATVFVAGGAETFDARSVADGKVLWSKPLATRTTPVVSAGVVFVVAGASLRGLDASSGRDRWSAEVGEGPVHASAQAGRVVVASSTGIGAFRAVDGSAVWQRALGASVTVPPVIDADRVFLALSDGRLVGVNLSTGETIWTVWLVSAPTGLLVGNGLLYFGAADGKLSAFTQDRGILRWAYALGSEPIASPVTDGRRVYTALRDHSVWAVDARTGNLRWRSPVAARPAVSPWRDETSLVVALVTGEVDMMDAATGKTSSTVPAPAPVAGVLVDFPARLQGVSAPDRGSFVRLTLDADQRKSTLVAFTRAKPPAK
jgi:outer membrane protein assembly factor BamB